MPNIVYPVTATIALGDDQPTVMQFETVEQWSDHVEHKINRAMLMQCSDIVPREENKEHQRMFDGFSIEFLRNGQPYGSVNAQLRMPVPRHTMIQ